MANLVFSLHISLQDAWQYSFKEYYAICDVANPDGEKEKASDEPLFSDDELKQLEHLKTLV